MGDRELGSRRGLEDIAEERSRAYPEVFTDIYTALSVDDRAQRYANIWLRITPTLRCSIVRRGSLASIDKLFHSIYDFSNVIIVAIR